MVPNPPNFEEPPCQRLAELAGIFARGFLRLKSRNGEPSRSATAATFSLPNPLKSDRQDLEQSRDLRLSVSRGERI